MSLPQCFLVSFMLLWGSVNTPLLSPHTDLVLLPQFVFREGVGSSAALDGCRQAWICFVAQALASLILVVGTQVQGRRVSSW